MIRRSTLLVSIAVMLVAGVVTESRAATFSMSGTFKSGCCNFPGGPTPTIHLQTLPFAAGGGGVTIRTGMPTSVAYVDQVVPGGTLMIQAGAISMYQGFTAVSPTAAPPSFKFLSTVVGFNNVAGTLAPGGGPGNVAYCVNNMGTATNANPNCTVPALGGAPFGGNRIGHAVPSGAPNFGGTMLLLDGLPVNNFTRTLGTPVVFAQQLSGMAFVDIVGNAFSLYHDFIGTVVINSPGGTTTAMTTVREAGIPWGTGTVFGTATGQAGGAPFPTVSFSYMGGDTRNASGIGNLNLVSAHVASFAGTGNDFVNGIRMSLNLPEPRPTLALLAGVGLLVGLELLRRRRHAGA